MAAWSGLSGPVAPGLKKAAAKYIAAIDECELTVRLAEAAMGLTRPPEKTPDEIIKELPADWGPAFQRAARAAMLYWNECIEASNRTN